MSGIGDALGGMFSDFGNTLANSGTGNYGQPVKTGADNTIQNLGKNIGQLMKQGGGNSGNASGQIIRDNPYADADLQEPSGEAHWTLREEDNFILAKNQRTGELEKLMTSPLNEEEKQQAMAPHGAGSLEANDPNRQHAQMSDGELGSPPVPQPAPIAAKVAPPVQQQVPQQNVDARGMPILQQQVPWATAPTPQTSPADAVNAAFNKIDEAQANHANLKNAEMMAYQQAMKDAKESVLKTAGTSHETKANWQEHPGNAGTYIVDDKGHTYYIPNGGKAALDVLTGPSGIPSQRLTTPEGAPVPIQTWSSGGGQQNYDFDKKTYKDADLKSYKDADLGYSSPKDIVQKLSGQKMDELGMKMMAALDQKFRGKK